MITTTTSQSPKGCITAIQMLGIIEMTHPIVQKNSFDQCEHEPFCITWHESSH